MAGSLKLATELRRAGFKVSSHLKSERLQKQFRQADRLGAKAVLILGPDEMSKDSVAVKDLASGEQLEVARSELFGYIHRLLEAA